MHLFLVAAAAVLAAGCMGDPQAEQPAVTGPSTSDAPSASPVDPANGAPTAFLAADPVIGKAPLDVHLSLAGSDPEGDALRWAVDFDGDGTPDQSGSDLPVRLSHRFPAGTHTVQLAVHDGNRAIATSLDITAEG